MSNETSAARPLALSQREKAPARSLAAVAVLCDPYEPLDPELDAGLVEDLTKIRGGDRLGRLVRAIRRSQGTPTLHLLTGHLGAGKTTELKAVRRRLERYEEGGGSPLVVLSVDADALLDKSDVDLEDLLVAIWRVVFDLSPRSAAKVLVPLWKQQIEKGLKVGLTNLPIEITENLDGLLKRLRISNFEQRKQIRSAIAGVSTALIRGLNDAFNDMRKVSDDDVRNVVVLIDNLEKLNASDRKHVERLYLDRLWSLKELDAHLVVTVPIYLAYSAAGGSLAGLYGTETVMLPMIKVRESSSNGSAEYAPGVETLVHLLQRRVDFDALFEEKTEAARRIALASGGCIRHALRITAGAANECDRPPVTRDAVDRSIAILRADFERALPESWVPALRQIHETNRFPAELKEDDKREMLRHLFVLEYQNGEPHPWHDVHPLVLECRKFQSAKS